MFCVFVTFVVFSFLFFLNETLEKVDIIISSL